MPSPSHHNIVATKKLAGKSMFSILSRPLQFVLVFYFFLRGHVNLCKSVQFRHLYRKLRNKNQINSTRKSRIKFPLVLVCLIWLLLVGGKRPDLHAPLQRTNSSVSCIRKWYRQNFLWPELTPYSFYPTELLFRVWHLWHLLQICRFFWIRCILRSHETDKFLTYAIFTISNITSLAFTDKWSLGIMAYSISITSMSFRWTLVNI